MNRKGMKLSRILDAKDLKGDLETCITYCPVIVD